MGPDFAKYFLIFVLAGNSPLLVPVVNKNLPTNEGLWLDCLRHSAPAAVAPAKHLYILYLNNKFE